MPAWLDGVEPPLHVEQVLACFAEGIFVADARRRILAVNPAFSIITGFAPADVTGAIMSRLNGARMDAAACRSMWRALRSTGHWRGELQCCTSAGVQLPLALSLSAVRDEHAVLTHYVGVFSDLSERKAEEERMVFRAQHDALTGLPNRYLLGERLTRALATASGHDGPVALLFLDLDRFKLINDSLGHRVGDLLLRSVAARLQSLIRPADTVARVGGDEFVFLLPHVEHPDVPATMAQRIISAMAAPYDIEGECLSIGASVGISMYPADAADADMLTRNADSAMYNAKARGGNCFEFYTAKLTSRAVERLILENSLRSGLEHDEFFLFYQPLVALPTGRVVGAEALLRWSHPMLGILGPDRFIPTAEETGLIVDIGEWVLRRACSQNSLWQRQGLRPIRVSVNVSARQCRPQLVSAVSNALADSALDACYLALELTETTLMGEVGDTLHKLKALGVQLSIDDFGIGYSSLGYLKRFPIDNLKVDKSLIAEIGIGDRNSSIAGATIALAHSLNLTVTAEGAYAAWQGRYLRERGCDLVQGYYFSRPLPPHKLASLLRDGRAVRLGPGYMRSDT